MGVAGLFGFLRRRYPEIVEQCAQQADELEAGASLADNFYVDLNHIIHACTHASWREQAHAGEEEMFLEVDLYLDRLVGLVRPTRTLLVAMDGVAPAAKMAQQRGRRFYSAHLERQKAEVERQVRRELEAEVCPKVEVPPLPSFDGNVITPGTAFMARLSAHLAAFFAQKLDADPDWQHLIVVFSDSGEAGEGEHKILRFMRQQRAAPGYDPNTRHCIYGQDADLILLGLLTHEPHLCLLREAGTLQEAAQQEGEEEQEDAMWSPVARQPVELLRVSTLRDCLRCELAEFCEPQQQEQQEQQWGEGGEAQPEMDLVTGQPIRVHPRRRAGKGKDKGQDSGRGWDFERLLDDVVLITFLAGNDFLPALPSLDIYDKPSALDTLMEQYKEVLRSGRHGAYLTSAGRLDHERLAALLQRLGALEEQTFQQREQRRVREQRRRMQQEAERGGEAGGNSDPADASWMAGGGWVSVGVLAPGQSLDEALQGLRQGGHAELPATAQLAHDGAALRREVLARVQQRMHDMARAGMEADPVRLCMPGYRARYYHKRFDAEGVEGADLEQQVRRICASYCTMLCWTLAYYCRGTPPAPPADSTASEGSAAAEAAGGRGRGPADPGWVPYASWACCYEHHYAPLASDLARHGRQALRGALAAATRPAPPAQPFAQLMAVLPFSSMPACLPPAVVAAALHPDEGLVARHRHAGAALFPEDVAALVDLSGKRWSHTAVVQLPFPDLQTIDEFVREVQADGGEALGGGSELTEEERQRNAFRPALLLMSMLHPLAPCLLEAQAQEEGLGSSQAASAPPCGDDEGGKEGPRRPAGAPVLELVPRRPAGGEPCGVAASGRHAVLCVPADLAGQEVAPFSPALLPGAVEGERVVTQQSWNRRRLAEQRRRAERAVAALRSGRGRGLARGRGSREARGIGSSAGWAGGAGAGGGRARPAPAPAPRQAPPQAQPRTLAPAVAAGPEEDLNDLLGLLGVGT